MNSRKLLKLYAQSKGKKAVSFIKLEEQQYSCNTLYTKDDLNNEEQTSVNYKELFFWIVNKFKIEEK